MKTNAIVLANVVVVHQETRLIRGHGLGRAGNISSQTLDRDTVFQVTGISSDDRLFFLLRLAHRSSPCRCELKELTLFLVRIRTFERTHKYSSSNVYVTQKR